MVEISNKRLFVLSAAWYIISFWWPRKAIQILPRPTLLHVVLAGYWVKFSTSNNSTSDKPHWLLYRHCAKLENTNRLLERRMGLSNCKDLFFVRFPSVL